MSAEHGPADCAPLCLGGCGDTIRDDGPEQTDAFLEGFCEDCHAAHVASLSDEDESDFYGGSVPVVAGEQAAQWGGK